MDDVVVINSGLSIPRAELSYRASRSGGPGGQHVNTSSTRVELLWDVLASQSITEEQRERIRDKLAKRIGEDGVLRVVSATSRSQYQNKEEVTERFARLLDQALHTPKPRKRTKPSRASKEARLRQKKQRSEAKKRRGKVDLDE
jgi:ribosome-associated protein